MGTGGVAFYALLRRSTWQVKFGKRACRVFSLVACKPSKPSSIDRRQSHALVVEKIPARGRPNSFVSSLKIIVGRATLTQAYCEVSTASDRPSLTVAIFFNWMKHRGLSI